MEVITQLQQWFARVDIRVLFFASLFCLPLIWLWRELSGKAQLRIDKALLENKVEDGLEDFAQLQTQYERLNMLYEGLSQEQQALEQQNHKVERELAVQTNALSLLQEQLTQQRQVVQGMQESERELLEQIQVLDKEKLSLHIQDQHKEQRLQELQQYFDQSRQQLSAEFESLANKIMHEKTQIISQANQYQMGQLMQPLKEQLDGFQRRVNEVHDQSREGQQMLKQHIQHVMDMGIKMSTDAQALARALKGDKKALGNWGEMQLEYALEQAGLIREQHYFTQRSYKDEQGGSYLPDVVLFLPEDKHLIIDSKVSLNAYQEALQQTEQQSSQYYLQQHIKAVRQHINDLASKDYSRLIGLNSPGFVFMFMPLEAAYIEALKQDSALFQDAYSKGIVLVSQTTLMPTLRTIGYLWMMANSNQQAMELGDKALEIHNQVARVSAHLMKLGNMLNTATKQYNTTIASFAGQQGLTSKIERFKDLSTKASKDLQAPTAIEITCQAERLDPHADNA